MATTRFEWDEHKNEINQRKHKVDFETATRVFADPFALSEQDRIEGGEERWQTIGLVEGYLVLLIAHAVYDQNDDENGEPIQIIRIISARKADRKERQRYENEIR